MVVFGTTYNEYTRSRNMKATIRVNHKHINHNSCNGWLLHITRFRNMEATFREIMNYSLQLLLNMLSRLGPEIWMPLLWEIINQQFTTVVIVTTFSEHTRSRNMKALLEDIIRKKKSHVVVLITTYTDHTGSRNMETTLIGIIKQQFTKL